jgi:hypothetical protein
MPDHIRREREMCAPRGRPCHHIEREGREGETHARLGRGVVP